MQTTIRPHYAACNVLLPDALLDEMEFWSQQSAQQHLSETKVTDKHGVTHSLSAMQEVTEFSNTALTVGTRTTFHLDHKRISRARLARWFREQR